MKILLTNDDGLDAPGISALHTAIQSLGEVMVVAPANGQSAESHGITFHTPLMTRTAHCSTAPTAPRLWERQPIV
jgi:5'-nucleotidase